ncbi:MAG: hypothetical protein RBR69_00645 [Candidatus Cloacimonadaceae bacterium]|jgi:hypothetical protein|nr:hypothetical protein [Candidatus Cloacimonadota bacterium]MDY0126630.1 hypothetical protein [Candidatus Cloacimonadaceae bacterium]MCB5255243.1 hypothetical protein [Candidatus Cloacimonadota bacterium]MCK9177465.1 hypothetical protein [Candidatus Cloacimonadota bacterium]MCK9242320.1 hypothetical protein [Candidatus Cloacimonadota bacterium]
MKLHKAKALSLIGILLLLLSSGSLWAQSRIGLIGMSALVPGSAEIAMGKTNRGVALLMSDIVATYSFFKTNHDMDLKKDAYKNYALTYAGVPLYMPQNHYQVIQEYISSEEFNDFQDMMARNFFVIYHNDIQGYIDYMEANTYTGEESWQWQSNMHWEKYIDMRKAHQRIKINHNLALGVMLLNRAISVIDTAILSKNVNVYASPHGSDGMMLNYEMRF